MWDGDRGKSQGRSEPLKGATYPLLIVWMLREATWPRCSCGGPARPNLFLKTGAATAKRVRPAYLEVHDLLQSQVVCLQQMAKIAAR